MKCGILQEKLGSNRKSGKVEAKYEEIEEVVLEFLRLAREQGETVTGPMLRQSAEEEAPRSDWRISKSLKNGYLPERQARDLG